MGWEYMLSKGWNWFQERTRQMPNRDPKGVVWFLFSFWLATSTVATIIAIGNPVGASLGSHLLLISKGIAINSVLLFLSTLLLALLFSYIYLPLPRLLFGSFIYTIVLTIIVLDTEKSGRIFSYVMGVSYGVIAFVLGLVLFILFHKKLAQGIKIAVILTIALLFSSYYIYNELGMKETIPATSTAVERLDLDNPGKQGEYDYSFLTYGAGSDLHRVEFGEEVDEITETIDASSRVTKWGSDRAKFWGFDQKSLPINGRTWIPEGEGPFPIVLMVHGNHTMEYFSTDGYDYLGEHLASRGFIAISVDEDFINYSNTYGIPNDNYELRAWMMLQHLATLQELNANPDSNFYEKIDFDQVALAGHSRGGQAALMATDYMSFFADDPVVDQMENVSIQGVVAIAPTDKKIQDQFAQLHNVSFLLLHGAKDADVSSYRSDRQFYRATFDEVDDGFKASVYLTEGNHTQFNTSWGRKDLSYPRGLFLSHQQTMQPEEQQKIAQVYLGAFFESIFNGKEDYKQFFANHHTGENWLPETPLITKFRDASYQSRYTFDQDDLFIMEEGIFTDWDVITPKDRQGSSRLRDALMLEWKEDAAYSLDLTIGELDTIVLTMANLDDEKGISPEIDVELEMKDGSSARIALDEFMPFPSVVFTEYTLFGLFEETFRDGKYDPNWEPVFQTFDLPVERFLEENEELRKEAIEKMTLHFHAPGGKIAIEEIGVW